MLAAAVLILTLTERFAELEKTSGGRLGISVQAADGGETHELNGGERFPMQSVYKLPIAMAVLDLVERGSVSLQQKVTLTARDMDPLGFFSPLRDRYPNGGIGVSVRDLIRAAIVDSDGVASDALYRLAGGGSRVTAYLRAIGVRDMDVATTEREMSEDPTRMTQYRNSSTPRAAVALLRALHAGRGVSPAARALLLKDLAESVPGANRLKGLLPPGTLVAHKTGTDATVQGLTRATNDIGIITLPDGRPLAMAVLLKDSTADQATRERTIATAARLAFDTWTAR